DHYRSASHFRRLFPSGLMASMRPPAFQPTSTNSRVPRWARKNDPLPQGRQAGHRPLHEVGRRPPANLQWDRGGATDDAAKAVGTSKRTLARQMPGKSPLSYFQSLRVERAAHLLRASSASVDEIAARVGYTEGSILRVLLRRRLGLGHESRLLCLRL